MRFLIYIIIAIVLSACAKVEEKTITITTNPQGANITVSENDPKTGNITKHNIGLSPVDYTITPKVVYNNSTTFDDDSSTGNQQGVTFEKNPQYTIFAKKDGYFSEEKSITDSDAVAKKGKFSIKLYKSPMWWDTQDSPATNQWINLIVSPDISNDDMWQRVIDAVTKRFVDLNDYDFNSGYLTTVIKTKSYKTKRGTFLLRSKFTATIMDKDPLTYRLKLDSQWSSGEGITWNPYPRVFTEDAELITELMSRFQAY